MNTQTISDNNSIKKLLIIGLDLSSNSSAITTSFFELPLINDEYLFESINHKNIVFDLIKFDESNGVRTFKNAKKHSNVNYVYYHLPNNISFENMTIDLEDVNSAEQNEITLKASICSANINNIIRKNIECFKPDVLIYSIENYVMPTYGGKTQLKNVGLNIMIQGYIRDFLIKYCLKNKIKPLSISTPPTSLKLFFALNGSAEKFDMLKSFINRFDGTKLIPDLKETDVASINDVVDSFALMVYSFSKVKSNFSRFKKLIYN
jgi:hypothetical protein